MRVTTEREIRGQPLAGKAVSVIGFGNQGEAHALNLKDSGVSVAIGLRPGSRSRKRAAGFGLEVSGVEEACSGADVVALMLPDEVLPKVFADSVAPYVKEGSALVFAHGFAVRFGGIEPPAGVDLVMVAPMGPGQRLRERYVEGSGLPASIAVGRDATGAARQVALEYGKGIGCARIGLLETTFTEEVEIDLFSEQAVLAGGVTRLIAAGFETLVEAGYSPQIAYIQCLYELKLTVDLIHRYGISGMRGRISGTALFGDLTRGHRVIGPSVKTAMKEVLEEVRDGTFAAEWRSDGAKNHPVLKRRLAEESDSMIEDVGRELAGILHEEGAERPPRG